MDNDQAHDWMKDPELGYKIFNGTHFNFQYGQVVEQVHADGQSLIVTDGYGGEVIASTSWSPNQTTKDRDVELMKSLAAKLGYKVSKPREVVTKK